MAKWITVQAFSELTGVTENTIYVNKTMGVYPNKTIKPMPMYEKKFYIDLEYFEKRLEFQRRILNKLHCYYYVLSRYFNDTQLSQLVAMVYDRTEASVRNVLSRDMFAMREPKLGGTPQVSKFMWEVFRVFRHILRHIFRLKGLKLSEVDLMKLHDLGDK